MREVIGQILENTYDYEKGTLDFSCTKLEIELKQGESFEGSFRIFASAGKYTKGYVSTTDLRMECLTNEFVGNEEEIRFCFHGEWMEEGEVTRGEFCVVSNRGEYYLPYVVTVMPQTIQSSVGPVKNLFHFANLAKSDWREALKLFYSPAFDRLLKDCDEQTRLIYRGLSDKTGNEQHMEEFLIAMNKKKPIEYLVTEKNLITEAHSAMAEETINVVRNGWGYTRLEIVTEGDFVFTEKSVITEDDFLGNQYRLPIYIDSSMLHAGKNFARVTLKSAYNTVCVPITVNNADPKAGRGKRLERKKNILELEKLYQDFRLKRLSSAAWIKKTIKIIDKMVAADEKDAATRLFQAQMLITCERYNEAGWILEHVGDLLQGAPGPAMEAYYLYLGTLLKKDEFYTADVEEKVARIYKEHGRDWRVAWLLLFLSEEYSRDMVSRWGFLEEQFRNGCRSPLIYVEAIQLLNTNPTLLRKLGAFELQVLNYGNKQGVISPETLEQLIYQAPKVREYSPILLLILKGCCEKQKDNRILKEICTLLIKANKVGKEYFEWYARGIEAELRILNIYEYYMLSMDLDAEPEIPVQVLLYFRYQSNLDYVHSAYLYYYVTQNRKVYPELFEGYRQRIEHFVVEQLKKVHINMHLAYLYQTFLEEDRIDIPMAKSLSQVLFMNQLDLQQPGIRYAVVCQPDNHQEAIYSVVGNRVYVPLYDRESCILFEDMQGNRFVKEISYTKEELMERGKLLRPVTQMTQDNPALDLYICESRMDLENADENDLQRWLRLLEMDLVSAKRKQSLVLKVLQYYSAREEKELLQEYLEGLKGEALTGVERAEVIRHMVLAGLYEKAYEWLLFFGDYGVEEKLLLHLLETIIEQKDYACERELLDYGYCLFAKGKYSSVTLKYVMKYYQGMLRRLRELWKASQAYNMNRRDFCERMLVQTLFSGTYIAEQTQVFKEYVYAGANAQIEQAFLRKTCYDYFVKDSIIAREILTEVGRLHSVGHEVGDVCKLAYLKYYADAQEEIQASDEGIIRDFMGSLLQKGICLKCMVDLRRYSGHELFLADKTIIEYRAAAGSTVRLHYLFTRENGEVGEYVTEGMTSVVGKVCFKPFVLFFGESLQYYITEEIDGTEKLTQSGTCRRGDDFGEQTGGKYSMLNDIIISKTMQDYHTFDSLLEEYYKKEFFHQKLFTLMS